MELTIDESELTWQARRDRFIRRNSPKEGVEAARRQVIHGEPTEYWLFKNGSRLAHDPLGQNHDPPANTLDRLRLMMEYRQIRLREALRDIENYQNAIRFHFDRKNFKGTYCGPSYIGTHEEVLAKLKELKLKEWRARNHCKAVEEKISDLLKPPEKTMDERILEKQCDDREDQFWRKVKKLTA